MEKITIEIPENIAFMKKVSPLEWSFLATKVLQSKFEELAHFKKIIEKSKLTEKDVEELTNKINASLSERY